MARTPRGGSTRTGTRRVSAARPRETQAVRRRRPGAAGSGTPAPAARRASSAAEAPIPGAPSGPVFRGVDLLSQADPAVAQCIEAERRRQAETVSFVAAENHASRAVLDASGSILTNKYAEGYPGARSYPGCQEADRLEDLARSRAKLLFGAGHANVQPYSGSTANHAAYQAFLAPGETVLAMDPIHGGHTTHGSPANFSGREYRFLYYGCDPATERIDPELVRAAARACHPKLIVAGASLYPREIPVGAIAEVAREVGAFFMVDMAHIAGLVAAGMHPNPVPVADVVTSTTHKTLRGPRGGLILCRQEHAARVDAAVFPGTQGGPLLTVIAAKAVAFAEAATPAFRAYQDRVVGNARILGDALRSEGFRLVTGGTDTHLVVADLRAAGLSATPAAKALESIGLLVNAVPVPLPPAAPGAALDPSPRGEPDARAREPAGLRLGTPAATTRGMGPTEMRAIASWVARIARAPDDAKILQNVAAAVRELAATFPPPA